MHKYPRVGMLLIESESVAVRGVARGAMGAAPPQSDSGGGPLKTKLW